MDVDENNIRFLRTKLVNARVRIIPYSADSLYGYALPPGRISSCEITGKWSMDLIVELDKPVFALFFFLASLRRVRRVLASVVGTYEQFELFAEHKETHLKERLRKPEEFRDVSPQFWMTCRFYFLREGEDASDIAREEIKRKWFGRYFGEGTVVWES
jgi:hypothetical protein